MLEVVSRALILKGFTEYALSIGKGAVASTAPVAEVGVGDEAAAALGLMLVLVVVGNT